MICGEIRFKPTHSRFIGLKVARRLPSDETNTVGWSILAFRIWEILGVNGIKMTAYPATSASPSAANVANPLAPEIILARLLKLGSIAALKQPASRRYKPLIRRGGLKISVTIAP